MPQWIKLVFGVKAATLMGGPDPPTEKGISSVGGMLENLSKLK